MTPRKFEEIVAQLLADSYFKDVLLTKTSGDGGRDLIASRLFCGIPITFYFECKRFAADHRSDSKPSARSSERSRTTLGA